MHQRSAGLRFSGGLQKFCPKFERVLQPVSLTFADVGGDGLIGAVQGSRRNVGGSVFHVLLPQIEQLRVGSRPVFRLGLLNFWSVLIEAGVKVARNEI